eukprot:13889042-Alexandrium_andersonii.AAC.1
MSFVHGGKSKHPGPGGSTGRHGPSEGRRPQRRPRGARAGVPQALPRAAAAVCPALEAEERQGWRRRRTSR